MQEVTKMMYILVEANDTCSISSPLKTTNRIKFLSFAASSNFIVFGATSGGLYVYDRQSCTFISLIPNKEGPVTCVKISPDEKWFGFSTVRGISCVLEHNGSSVNRRILSHEHEGMEITTLQWNFNSTQLYIGDNTGRISVIRVASYLTPAISLMQLDSSIVQLDSCKYMLLASTKTRSYLCDTFREQYRQIGTRLRDGDFGACFFSVDSRESYLDAPPEMTADFKDYNGGFSALGDGEWLLADKYLQNIKLFCARPGLRLWEVRVDGAVISTHQFKQLQKIPPVSVINPAAERLAVVKQDNYSQGGVLHFSKLYKLYNKHLLTFDSHGFCVLDPMTSEVVLWTDQFKNIVDVFVVDEVIYLWMGGCKLHALSFTPIDKYLVRLYLAKQYLYCTQLCAAHTSSLKKLVPISSKMHVLVDLLEKLKEDSKLALDEEILEKASEFVAELSKNVQNKERVQMLNSGIFIVGNAHLLSQKEELRIGKQSHYSSEKKPSTIRKVDISVHLSSNENSLHHENDHSDSSCFRNFPSTPSQPSSDEDYDPFPDLPLSSLTSAEAVIALRNLTTTVSGTISNGTKSLKEKWQNFEERLRGHEESGLSVEKSINRCDAHLSYESGKYDDKDEDDDIGPAHFNGKLEKLPLKQFIDRCHDVSDHEDGDDSNLQELRFKMLDSFAILYIEFRNHSQNQRRTNDTEDMEIKETNVKNFGKWLNTSDVSPFPFHIYFDKEFIVSLHHLLEECLLSGTLVKWLSQFIQMIDLDYQMFPTHIGRIHCKESLIIDQALGHFLEMCISLLDPLSALQCLDGSSASCQFFAWNVIMDHFQKRPVVSDYESSHTWPLPRTLNAMLVMLQLGQVESCLNIGEHISVKHVLRTVLKVKDNSEQIFSLFLSYLERLQDCKLQKEVKDPEVYYFTRYAFESLHKSKPDSQCVCGYPIFEGKTQKSHDNVGKALLLHLYETKGIREAFSFCQRTDGLWHHLLELRHNESLETVMPLILHVASEKELKIRGCEFSPSSWELLFSLRVRQEEGYCLKCSTEIPKQAQKISWTMLGSLLIQETNIEFAIDLLSKFSHSIPAGSLKINFYQSCLLASLAENQKNGLKKKLLAALTDHKMLPAISSKLSAKLGHAHGQSQHHWGIKLQLMESSCLCCMLPLGSSSGGSVVAFNCSHSFHSICLEQRLSKKCPVCVE